MFCRIAPKNRFGFTLIELLIVVVILSSLAAIVVPQFTSVGDASKNSSLAYNTKMVQGAIDRYGAENGFYPSKSDYGQICWGASLSSFYDLSAPYSFLMNRLTLYGNGDGGVCDVRKNDYILGPYLSKPIPVNPLSGKQAIKIIPTVPGQDDSSSDFGWTYDQYTGEFLPFDG